MLTDKCKLWNIYMSRNDYRSSCCWTFCKKSLIVMRVWDYFWDISGDWEKESARKDDYMGRSTQYSKAMQCYTQVVSIRLLLLSSFIIMWRKCVFIRWRIYGINFAKMFAKLANNWKRLITQYSKWKKSWIFIIQNTLYITKQTCWMALCWYDLV